MRPYTFRGGYFIVLLFIFSILGHKMRKMHKMLKNKNFKIIKYNKTYKIKKTLMRPYTLLICTLLLGAVILYCSSFVLLINQLNFVFYQ